MAERGGVDGRHKAGHDGLGSPSTGIATRAAILLDKIRNVRHAILIGGISPLGRRPGEAKLMAI